MSQIRACDAHGYFEGAVCPICGDGGRRVLDGDRRRRLSKFCSGALRHFPDDVGLALDDAGWVAVRELVAAVERKYDWADREAVAGVVATDPKGRFERTAVDSDDGERVRAAYGHSVAVDLADTDDPVPGTLYHGTAPRNVDSIRESGLEPMSRQQVHLSGDVETARAVGRRHADDPVVFAVDAAGLQVDGQRVTRRGEGVYTTDAVSPAHLELLADEG